MRQDGIREIFCKSDSLYHIYLDRSQGDTPKVHEYYEKDLKAALSKAASSDNMSFLLTYMTGCITQRSSEAYPSEKPVTRRWRASHAGNEKLSWTGLLRHALRQKAENVVVFLDSEGYLPTESAYKEICTIAGEHVFRDFTIVVINDVSIDYRLDLQSILKNFCDGEDSIKIYLFKDFIEYRNKHKRHEKKKTKSNDAEQDEGAAAEPESAITDAQASPSCRTKEQSNEKAAAECYVMLDIVKFPGEKMALAHNRLPGSLSEATAAFKEICRNSRPHKSLLINVISNEVILVYETVEHFSSGKVI